MDAGNPDCINFNPCLNAQPTSADFTICEQSGPLKESDTVLIGNYILFTANQELESYDWQVGLDTLHRYTKSFDLYFRSAVGTINVTLIGKRKPNHFCFPHDDGVDTVVKQLTVVSQNQTKLYGKYTGYLTIQPKDTFTIQIKVNDTGKLDPNFPVLVNLPDNCPTIVEVDPGYKDFRGPSIWDYEECRLNSVSGYLEKDNQTIHISFRNQKNQGFNKPYKFIGKRQP